MKHLLAAVLTAALIPVLLHAQSKPDFSGTWKMDPTRSESAAQTEPIGPVTMVITQTPDAVRIETTRLQGSSVVTYKLDGSEITIPDGTAKTHWEGSTLVTEMVRYVHGQAVTTKETRILTAGGNEMLVDLALA